MNIFEVSDRSGDTFAIDLDEVAGNSTGKRFMATTHDRDVKSIVSVEFADDAARALIKALRENLPPEQNEQAITVRTAQSALRTMQNNTGRDEPVAPTYRPKRADYIRQAITLLRDQRMEFCPGDVVQLAYFLSETGS